MVTGVAAYWGDQLSRLLLDDTPDHVIGIDRTVPRVPPHENLDFVQADVRNRLLTDLLRQEQVDTVYHLAWPPESDQATAALDNLLHACAETGVAHFIWVSSTAVYGPLPTNAAFIDEDQSPYTKETAGPLFDLIAGEQLCFDFARHYPHLKLTVLRPAHIVGPQAPGPMNRYLSGSVAPVLLGFDPMMQVVDERDLLLALRHALDAPPVSAGSEHIPANLYQYNVAAADLLPLTRLLSLTHTLPLPLAHPLAYWGTSLLLRAVPWSVEKILPYGWDFLRYRCVGAVERQAQWGFATQYSGLEAVRTLAEYKQMDKSTVPPSDLALDERRLQQTLAQRQQAKKERKTTNGEK
jgi:UDP-glucose 4-epimerase